MLGTFTFTSCHEDDDFTTKTNLKPNNENYISQTAIDFAKSIKSQGATRSILSSSNHLHSLSVQELNLKHSFIQTRSSENAPKFYAVSLSADNGTVLVAAKNNEAKTLEAWWGQKNIWRYLPTQAILL